MKKKILVILAPVLISVMIPILIIAAVVAPVTVLFGGDGLDAENNSKYSIVDVAVFAKPKLGSYNGSLFDDQKEITKWIIKCQKEIHSMRESDYFANQKSDDNTTRIKKSDAKERASAFILNGYMNNDKSPIPAGKANKWNELANCFVETALDEIPEDNSTYDYSIDTNDACWKKLENTYGISISSEDKENISMIYGKIHLSKYYELPTLVEGSVGDLFEEEKYPESTMLTGRSTEAEALWTRIYNDASGGNFAVYNRSNPQCTDVAHWRFWSLYETDWSGGGNGVNCVDNIVNTFGDASHLTTNGYYFVKSQDPSGGAVFSRIKVSPYGHTGMIEKVEGDYLWYTDGNITTGGKQKGLRVNYKSTIENFKNNYCANGCTFAVPQGAN